MEAPKNIVPSKWLVLICTCLGCLLLNVDLFIVNVALPAISSNLNTPLYLTSWTISAYSLMLGIFPASMGKIGDLWGQKKLYITGLVIFTASSFACGMAGNIYLLIFFRIAQGIGAAALTPGTLSILVSAFPKEQRGLAIGLNGGIGALGLIAGPALGGLLVRGDNWRWIFFINVPLGVVTLLMTVFFVTEPHEKGTETGGIDWRGLMCLSIGLTSVLLAFTRAENNGFDSFCIMLLFTGIAFLAFFIRLENRVQNPLIDLSMFRNLGFSMPCISLFLFSAVLYGSQPYWSLFMQNFWKFTPLQGGLAFVPATTLVASLTPFGGIISQKSGNKLRYVTMTAIFLMGISFLYAAGMNEQSTYTGRLLPALLLRSVGIPIVLSATALSVMNSVSPDKSGLASGVMNMFKNTGTAMGVAILGQSYTGHINQFFFQQTANIPPDQVSQAKALAEKFTSFSSQPLKDISKAAILSGFQNMSIICAIICIPALVASFLIKNARES